MQLFNAPIPHRDETLRDPTKPSASRRFIAAAIALAFVFSASSALADGHWDFPQPHPVGEHVNVTTSIVLRGVIGLYEAPPSPSIIVVPDGAVVKLATSLSDAEIASVTWFKDGDALPATDKTLVIPRASAADAGVYTAQVQRSVESPVLYAGSFEKIRLQIDDAEPQKIVNVSTRATIDASNPSLIVGFVVDTNTTRPRANTTLLIRAIGPSLVAAGVVDPLNTPKVSLFDSRGNHLPWPEVYIPEWDPYHLASVVAPRVGASPLAPNTQDFAILQPLPTGAYTAHITSGDGDTGDVVFEVYEVPENVLPTQEEGVLLPPEDPTN